MVVYCSALLSCLLACFTSRTEQQQNSTEGVDETWTMHLIVILYFALPVLTILVRSLNGSLVLSVCRTINGGMAIGTLLLGYSIISRGAATRCLFKITYRPVAKPEPNDKARHVHTLRASVQTEP